MYPLQIFSFHVQKTKKITLGRECRFTIATGLTVFILFRNIRNIFVYQRG